MLFVLLEQIAQGFGVLLAALCFAGGVGEDALGFGLADTRAGVGFDGLNGGECPFFGGLLRHLCVQQIQVFGFC